ncbi:MAG: LysR family transcriptional regulator [Devosia sp.]|nr:LysR family transcriptional regulator [Devosia sp.]
MAKLEANTRTLLFERRANEMSLTEAGSFLLPKVEHVMRTIGELEDGFEQFQQGQRITIGIAGINSVLRVLLPQALATMPGGAGNLDFDILEAAPSDVLEYLYARRVKIGLLASNSVAEAGVGFAQIPLVADPTVLVVPKCLELEKVEDPQTDLSPVAQDMLNRAILFSFGTQHSKQIGEWYDRALPDHRIIARCRSFETAISLVGSEAGVCLAPLMSASGLDGERVRLFRIPEQDRRIVALVPTQYLRSEPYSHLILALQSAANRYVPPQTLDTPSWLRDRLR